ncbi:MAG: hypothetical protein AAFR27_02380 [Pseudomonadota bacterium]
MKLGLQNRVTPFGDIIATPARGTLTGNRGIIHDPDLRRLLPNRRWSTKAWIYCLCAFQNRKRDVFGYNGRNGGAGWTNLFFLDEATALAAGHRPCFYCQRTRANAFRDAWISAFDHWPGVQSVDNRLHAERLTSKQKRHHPLPKKLVDGMMVACEGQAFVFTQGVWLCWQSNGYAATEGFDLKNATLLTPPSIARIIEAGFDPAIADTRVSGGVR